MTKMKVGCTKKGRKSHLPNLKCSAVKKKKKKKKTKKKKIKKFQPHFFIFQLWDVGNHYVLSEEIVVIALYLAF